MVSEAGIVADGGRRGGGHDSSVTLHHHDEATASCMHSPQAVDQLDMCWYLSTKK